MGNAMILLGPPIIFLLILCIWIVFRLYWKTENKALRIRPDYNDGYPTWNVQEYDSFYNRWLSKREFSSLSEADEYVNMLKDRRASKRLERESKKALEKKWKKDNPIIYK